MTSAAKSGNEVSAAPPSGNERAGATPRAFATFNPKSGRVTRLRLVSPGCLVSNEIVIGSGREGKFMTIEIEYCGQ
jgi:hypothetical protein